MQLVRAILVLLCLVAAAAEVDVHVKHDHHKKHDKANETRVATNGTTVAAKEAASKTAQVSKTAQEPAPKATEEEITDKMKTLEQELAKKEAAVSGVIQKGQIEVNGPLPVDFAERFAQAVAT